ncbi:Rieske (2Fe-2S) protein [Mucilaginibacter sp. X5P1]|uniref:Rieske (2Fe-2S) protein n=1 Tax=Mucilaginibacter sp. X5P1 TaxID=2723088 RepID=UPI00160E927D|nr:Rieske 2Fe-2S domain-containing protein [Mucilaginibacter sp. X5P1]MBB6137399.1 nitrite reductase/ring-hydroxylating ferredoxin subunit [Mucilaginibacter sp. X5P1]
MKWYKIPGIENSDKPFIKKVKAGSKSVCLVGYEGKIFALSAKCPHAGGDLSAGWCKDDKLICPLHRYSYDIHTGKGSTGQNDYVDVFPVEVRGDGIYIGVEGFWEKIKKGFS